MDDFFSSGATGAPTIAATDDELSTFEAAIGKRFSDASPSVLLTTALPLATNFPRTPAPASHPSRFPLSPPTPSRTPSGPLSQLSLSTAAKTKDPLSPAQAKLLAASRTDQATGFIGHLPKDIPALLRSSSSSSASTPPSSSSLLLIDIRNHNHYVHARLPGAINLSVPSTLLKRPAFVLAKLAEMIPNERDRTTFASWSSGRSTHIVVYDADTSILAQGNNVAGLLRKFQAEGFSGQLGYVSGGFNAVLRHQPESVDRTPLTPEDDKPEDPLALGANPERSLGSRMLPPGAFLQSSTVGVPGAKISNTTSGALHLHNISNNNGPAGSGPALAGNDTSSPFTSHSNSVSNNASASASASVQSSSLPLPLPRLSSFLQHTAKPTSIAVANPFYDNIRQNLELSSGITERIPLLLPSSLSSSLHRLPFQWLRDIAFKASARSSDGVVGGEALEDLAMQFYRIELGEQRRLTGVMEHHSFESTTRPGQEEVVPAEFPYSITAGVEKGAKNRYRNIWPFEHARVRLQHPTDNDGTGYINASYVQPRGTSLKYIATQGPLAATFTDFWTLVWEQNVNIILMLTKQIEGHSIKCHCYWKGEEFGPLRLELVSVEGPVEEEVDVQDGGASVVGFDFAAPVASSSADGSPMKTGGSTSAHSKQTASANAPLDSPTNNQIIRRTFLLRHTDHPDAPPRKIVQLQFLGWPDLNVPSSSRALLSLVSQVDALRTEFRSMGGSDPVHPSREKVKSQPGPVLVHCSAGVGRTGSFVVIDAVLDAIRREARRQRQRAADRRKEPGEKGLSQSSEDSVATNMNTNRKSSADDAAPDSVFSGGEAAGAAETPDHDHEHDHARSSVVKLDSEGNEVASPDAHSIKKRKSSTGRDGLRPDFLPPSTDSRPITPPPPVPPLNFNLSPSAASASRQQTKPFELDARKLQSLQKRASASVSRALSPNPTPHTNPVLGGSQSQTQSGIAAATASEQAATPLTSRSVDSLGSSSLFRGSSGGGPGSFFSTPTSTSSTSAWATSVSLASLSSLPYSDSPIAALKSPDADALANNPGGNSDRAPGTPQNVANVQDAETMDTRQRLTSLPGSFSLRLPTPGGNGTQLQSKSPLPTFNPRLAAASGGLRLPLTDPLPTAPATSTGFAKDAASSSASQGAFSRWQSGLAAAPAPSEFTFTSTNTNTNNDAPRTQATPSFIGGGGPVTPSLSEAAFSTGTGAAPSGAGARGDTNSAYDYTAPRKLYLVKEVKRNAKAASERAAAAEQLQLQQQQQRRNRLFGAFSSSGFVASPSPLASSSITAEPKEETNKFAISIAKHRRMRSTGTGGIPEDEGEDAVAAKESSSSDELSPSSPEPLDEIEEPIRQVLEDMRQQRMSLCQSLRQYVFVHLAILEGALAISEQLDEEERVQAKELAAAQGGRPSLDSLPALALGPSSKISVHDFAESDKLGKDNVFGHSNSSLDRILTFDEGTTAAGSVNLSTIDTRVDSLRAFSKRPSVKRKKRSDNSESGSPQYERMVID